MPLYDTDPESECNHFIYFSHWLHSKWRTLGHLSGKPTMPKLRPSI